MGTGLGAVRRLAADFDAVSEPGSGTIVLARFTTERPPGQRAGPLRRRCHRLPDGGRRAER